MRSRPNAGSAISVESAALLCAIVLAASDDSVRTQGIILALRGADEIAAILKEFARSRGLDPDGPTSVDLSVPVSKEEVKALLSPVLKSGAELASLGQILDGYIWDMSPDSLVYAFYIGIRFVVARERPPTPQESKKIWELTLRLAKASKIGNDRWVDLQAQGQIALDDWIRNLKQAARKKYETFLRQKKAIDASAEAAFKTLISIFD